jgi:hypothetical protein
MSNVSGKGPGLGQELLAAMSKPSLGYELLVAMADLSIATAGPAEKKVGPTPTPTSRVTTEPGSKERSQEIVWTPPFPLNIFAASAAQKASGFQAKGPKTAKQFQVTWHKLHHFLFVSGETGRHFNVTRQRVTGNKEGQ